MSLFPECLPMETDWSTKWELRVKATLMFMMNPFLWSSWSSLSEQRNRVTLSKVEWDLTELPSFTSVGMSIMGFRSIPLILQETSLLGGQLLKDKERMLPTITFRKSTRRIWIGRMLWVSWFRPFTQVKIKVLLRVTSSSLGFLKGTRKERFMLAIWMIRRSRIWSPATRQKIDKNYE